MAAPLVKDPRIRSVAWKDLLHLTWSERVRELMLCLPWLAGELYLSAAQLFGPALACSFMLFLAGIRQGHNAQHYTLGLTRRGTEVAMFVLSVLLLGSIHAVQVTHRGTTHTAWMSTTSRRRALGCLLSERYSTVRFSPSA